MSNILNKFLKFAKFELKHFDEYNLTKKCVQGKMCKGGQELFSFFYLSDCNKKIAEKMQKLDSSQKFKVTPLPPCPSQFVLHVPPPTPLNVRSLLSDPFFKKGVLKNFIKLTEKYLRRSLNFFKKETPTQVFSC